MAEKRESNKSSGTISVDIDCSEALKGLKAVTREAKKATSALQELEEQQKRIGLVPKLVKEE
jgi:D-serine deaminase-like pyridoxal phosphate-dependent protein